MNLNITAPTGGGDFSMWDDGQSGMVFFQAKNTNYSVLMKANVNIIGMSYLPNWDVQFNGHTQTITGNFVVNTASVNGAGGGSPLTLNPGTGSQAASPQIAVLVE